MAVCKGEALINLRRVVAALQRAACLGAVRKRAGRGGGGDDLAVLVGETREERLSRGDVAIESNVALVGRDR